MPWIWLDDKLYPQIQRNRYNILYDCENKNTEEFRYAVADISKTFRFDRTVEKIKIRVSADNTYILRINGKFIGIGPASSGGDFLCTGKTPKHYADIYELDFEDVDVLDIGAKVSLQRILSFGNGEIQRRNVGRNRNRFNLVCRTRYGIQ